MLAQSALNPGAQVNQPPSVPAAPSPEPATASPSAPPPTQPVPVTGAAPVPGADQPPPPRPLRRPRLAVAGSATLPRLRRAVVTLLLPEAGADANRADISVRLSALLRGHMFPNGTIPPYEATPGEALRVPRRSYAWLLFSWPSADDAAAFRRLFPLSLRLASSRTVLLKAYDDPHPEFTASKTNGVYTLCPQRSYWLRSGRH
ncbi:unnamed protein product [Closterium sp. Yama58-4]|nr:unnamed protein product [Closterium sp. Yama58-4]